MEGARQGETEAAKRGEMVLVKREEMVLAKHGEMVLAKHGEMVLAKHGEMVLAKHGEMVLAKRGEMVAGWAEKEAATLDVKGVANCGERQARTRRPWNRRVAFENLQPRRSLFLHAWFSKRRMNRSWPHRSRNPLFLGFQTPPLGPKHELGIRRVLWR